MNSESQACILILLLAMVGGLQNRRLSAPGGSLGRSDLPLVAVPTLRSRELTPLPTATEQGRGSAGRVTRMLSLHMGPDTGLWAFLHQDPVLRAAPPGSSL